MDACSERYVTPPGPEFPRTPADGFAVEEVQGLYGPFFFSEKLLQRIWRTGDFEAGGARLVDGRSVRIVHPGRWNLLGGPDFKESRLEFDGVPVNGDVELHLHAEDWAAHRHAADPAYDRVVLHAVLFPPDPAHRTRNRAGEPVAVLALLPLLQKGLEEFAADAAVERLAGRTDNAAAEGLGAFEAGAAGILRECAGRRWTQKVRFAALRLKRLGWEQACHSAALEILGYRFNRAPMLRIAGRWPIATWSADAPSLETLLESEREGWAPQGTRPANLPRTRLLQYLGWMAAVPDWPGRLRAAGAEVSSRLRGAVDEGETSAIRRTHDFPELRESWRNRIAGGQVGGSRFDTLICDGFLPLLAANGASGMDSIWMHWYPGDQPPLVTRTLRELGIAGVKGAPASHGLAQGFLGWLIERELQEEASEITAAPKAQSGQPIPRTDPPSGSAAPTARNISA